MSGPKTFSPVVPSCRGTDPFQMQERKKRKRVLNKESCLVALKRDEGSELAELGLCVGFPLPALH